MRAIKLKVPQSFLGDSSSFLTNEKIPRSVENIFIVLRKIQSPPNFFEGPEHQLTRKTLSQSTSLIYSHLIIPHDF